MSISGKKPVGRYLLNYFYADAGMISVARLVVSKILCIQTRYDALLRSAENALLKKLCNPSVLQPRPHARVTLEMRRIFEAVFRWPHQPIVNKGVATSP
jgi:hypothetical protein